MRTEDFIVKHKQDNLKHKVEVSNINDIDYINLRIECKEPTVVRDVEVEFYVPVKEFQHLWTPNNGVGKTLKIDWEADEYVKQTISAPVMVFFDHEETSRFSFACSDAIEPTYLKFGVQEETGRVRCIVKMFSENTKKITDYSATFRINLMPSKFNDEVKNISKWYETFAEYTPMNVPEAAYNPVYSTWYSYHQEVSEAEIEAQCKIGAEFGLKTLIVDDGWQTEDNHRGYAYTGDWELCESKFPTFKEHVQRVQDMGIKYMIWYSVPFMGGNSKLWKQFSDKIISHDKWINAAVLDVRYKDVREYLVNVYKRALIEWGIDGFKLDFIDTFNLHHATDKALAPDPARETESLTDAVNDLLQEIKEALTEINPDVLIEFRQRYIGPSMRSYGNMFRVNDCPYNVMKNRIGVVDLRLLSGNTAIHSDMIMWSKEESTESAALQLINVLFSVPQYSLDLNKINNEQFKMSKFYLSLWNQYKNSFVKGNITPMAPHLSYPVIYGDYEDELAITVHGDYIVALNTQAFNQIVVVNGAMIDRLIVELEEEFNGYLTIYNCLGEVVKTKQCTLPKGLQKIEVPKSGVITLNKSIK